MFGWVIFLRIRVTRTGGAMQAPSDFLVAQSLANRYEVADFSREALELGVRYLGLCCGAGLQHVRAMAEAAGAVLRRAATWRT